MATLSPAEQNALNRRLLIQNSPLVRETLPVVTGTLGQTSRIKLKNVGFLTRLFVEVSCPYTTTVAPTGITQKGAHALIPRVQLLDYDSSQRINTSAFHLAMFNAMRKRENVFGSADFSSLAGLTSVATGQTNDYRNPGIVTTVGAQTLSFAFEVPVAASVENGDLRGMMAMQFTSGEVQLVLDFLATLTGTGDDYVFNGGTFSVLGSPSITVTQEYYLPQAIQGVVPIPQMDIGTVYELGVYSRTTDNLAANMEKIVNFPNLRTVNGMVMSYINNAVLGGGSAANDLSIFSIKYNGANSLYRAGRNLQCYLQRKAIQDDLPQGCYFFDFANGPISTAIFGNVQSLVTPIGTLTNPALETSFESFYSKGAALSGIPT